VAGPPAGILAYTGPGLTAAPRERRIGDGLGDGDTGASGTKLLDMLMMLSLPGKERTGAEWRALYAAAGLRVASITPINPRSVESIIEGIPT